jgi:hypothetical protein
MQRPCKFHVGVDTRQSSHKLTKYLSLEEAAKARSAINRNESNATYKLKPRLVESLRNILIYKVVCSGNHTMALTA